MGAGLGVQVQGLVGVDAFSRDQDKILVVESPARRPAEISHPSDQRPGDSQPPGTCTSRAPQLSFGESRVTYEFLTTWWGVGVGDPNPCAVQGPTRVSSFCWYPAVPRGSSAILPRSSAPALWVMCPQGREPSASWTEGEDAEPGLQVRCTQDTGWPSV